MIQYIDPDTFEHQENQQAQSNVNSRGYPQQWQPPHFSGDNIYNPHLYVILNQPDGHREYYDPVTNTKSIEHPSGYHHAILTDGVVENVPGKKMSFVGGGGHSEVISGHHDVTRGGHYRENNQGDTYVNTKGVAHTMSQGGGVHVNMGNETHEHYGSVKHRIMGDNGAFGIGVGPGDGTNHDNAITVTKGRIYHKNNSNGDMVHESTSNAIYHAAGTTHNVSAQSDVNSQAQQGNTYHKSNQNHIIEAGANTYITGKNNQPGIVNINGVAYAQQFLIGSQPQQLPQMPQNPPSASGSSGGGSSGGSSGGAGVPLTITSTTASYVYSLSNTGLTTVDAGGTTTVNGSGFIVAGNNQTAIVNNSGFFYPAPNTINVPLNYLLTTMNYGGSGPTVYTYIQEPFGGGPEGGANTAIWLGNASDPQIYLSGKTNFLVANNIATTIYGNIYANGHASRSGLNGGFSGNMFNIYWTGSSADLFIDTTNMGTISTTSDYRIKKDIQDVKSALDEIKQWRPITYTGAKWGIFEKNNDRRHSFIAHELQKVSPDCVIGEKDSDQPQRLDLVPIITRLTKAIQEIDERLSKMENDK